jgi:hypothetical protein
MFSVPSFKVGRPTANIPYSIRFNSSGYMSRTPAASGNRTKWTFSAWVRRTRFGIGGMLLSGGATLTDIDNFGFNGSDQLYFNHIVGGTTYSTIWSLARDPSSHYHIQLVYDSALDATAAGSRVRLYVNGVLLTPTSQTNIPQNSPSWINHNVVNRIGERANTAPAAAFDGYMSAICFVDGQALPPETFGHFSGAIPAYYQWVSNTSSQILAAVGNWGNNGFALVFRDGTNVTTLGYDTHTGVPEPSTGNNFTLTGFTRVSGINDCWSLDTPSHWFNIHNPIDQALNGASVTWGGLKVTSTTTAYNAGHAVQPVKDGKWYWEVSITDISSGTGGASIGVDFGYATATNQYPGNTADSWGYRNNGQKINSATSSAYGPTYTNGDVIGVLLDMDNRTLSFLKQTGGAGDFVPCNANPAFTGMIGTLCYPMLGDLSGSVGSTFNVNFGSRPFNNQAIPAGYKSIGAADMAAGTVTMSGSFTGNANANGPYVFLNGTPEEMTINGNAVVWGTHADKLASGFKVRTANTQWNASGTNNYVVTVESGVYEYNNAQLN